jgi:hypothetical protein
MQQISLASVRKIPLCVQHSILKSMVFLKTFCFNILLLFFNWINQWQTDFAYGASLLHMMKITWKGYTGLELDKPHNTLGFLLNRWIALGTQFCYHWKSQVCTCMYMHSRQWMITVSWWAFHNKPHMFHIKWVLKFKTGDFFFDNPAKRPLQAYLRSWYPVV